MSCMGNHVPNINYLGVVRCLAKVLLMGSEKRTIDSKTMDYTFDDHTQNSAIY